MKQIAKLIQDYAAEVKLCLILLRQKFGRNDFICAWRRGAIPQAGMLGGGISYHFHGKGCLIEFTDHEIDFDFIDWEGSLAFDSWRLWLFASQYPGRYYSLQSEQAIEIELRDYADAEGLIHLMEDGQTYRLS